MAVATAVALLVGGVVVGRDQVEPEPSGRPTVSLEVPERVAAGTAIPVRVRIAEGTALGAIDGDLGFDTSAVGFGGLRVGGGPADQAGSRVRALPPVVRPDGVAFGAWSCGDAECRRGAEAGPAGMLDLHLQLEPSANGLIELSLDHLTATDAWGRPVAISLGTTRAVVRVGTGGRRVAVPDVPGPPSPALPVAPAPADLTGDGIIDQADVEEVAAAWLRTNESGGRCRAVAAGSDRDGDGCVTARDLQVQAGAIGGRQSAFGDHRNVFPLDPDVPAGPTFVVDSTGDEPDTGGEGICRTEVGTCTMRAALLEANRAVGHPTIAFAIPGPGVHTIAPATKLPSLSNPNGMTIDGYSQPEAQPNTDPLVSNAAVRIEFVGTGPAGIDGFFIATPLNVIRGIATYNFNRGLWLFGANSHDNRIVGTFAGTDATASFFAPAVVRGSVGIEIQGGAHNNLVGTPDPADRNVISGNFQHGLSTHDFGTTANVVQNNIIGLSPDASRAVLNRASGIDINTGTTDTLVGGSEPGESNLIGGNLLEGVEISHSFYTQRNRVVGNRIGTGPTGNDAPSHAANTYRGVRLEGLAQCDICGTDTNRNEVRANVIVNGGVGGIHIDKGADENTVADNLIGITADGTPAPNGIYGIRIEHGAQRNVIGPGNVITNNPNAIQMQTPGTEPPNTTYTQTWFNTVTRNSIYGNGGPGIDLEPLSQANPQTGPGPGANEQRNHPEVASIGPAVLQGTACAGCVVELFATDRAAGLNGPGRTYLRSATAGTDGAFTLPLVAADAGLVVTTTATSPGGSTSEFGRNTAIPPARPGNAAPTAAAAASCSHLTCTFSSAGSGDGDGTLVRTTWDFGDGTTGSGATATHRYSVPGTYTATVTVTDNDAATAIATATGTAVNELPVASAVATCSVTSCAFDGTGSSDPDGGVASWTWDFGDGTTGTGSQVSHRYIQPGTYTVVLTVADVDGATSTWTSAVTATPPPAGALATDTFGTRTVAGGWGSADLGGAYALSGTSASYAVSAGQGTITVPTAGTTRVALLPGAAERDVEAAATVRTEKAPTGFGQAAYVIGRHVATSTQYRARLRLASDGGAYLQAMKLVGSSTEIPIGAEIRVPGLAAAPTTTFGLRASFQGVNPTTIRIRTWDAAGDEPGTWDLTRTDGEAVLQSTTGSIGLASYVASSATNAPVTFTWDNLAATYTNTVPVAAAGSTCTNRTCVFDATGSGDPDGSVAAYLWDFGDGTTSNEPGPTHTYAAFGTYAASLTVTDNHGATTTAPHGVTVTNAPPVPAFALACTDLTCSADATASTDPDGSVGAYSWEFGDGTTASGATTSHTYQSGETYTILLEVLDDDGGASQTSQTVTVVPANELPGATFTATCADLACSFDASASSDPDGAITSYQWAFGDGATTDGPTADHTYAAGGTRAVTLTITDDRGGLVSASRQVTALPPNQLPTATATAGCAALACTFSGGTSSDPDGTIVRYDWVWSDGSATPDGGPNPSHGFAVAGTYPVRLTVTDDRGGQATATVAATPTPPPNPTVWASDSFGRSGTGGWGTADQGGAWTSSSSPTQFGVNGAAATVAITAPGQGRAGYLAPSHLDADLTAKVATSKVPTGFGQSASLIGRRVGTNLEYRTRLRMAPTGVFLAAVKLAGSSTEVLIGPEVQVPGLAWSATTPMHVRLQVTGTGPTTLRARAWMDGQPEPSTWAVTATDATAPLQAAGSIGVHSYLSSSATNAPATFTWDDIVDGRLDAAPTASMAAPVCSDGTCTFDGGGSSDPEGPVTLTWSFGDGATATGAQPQHTYAASGTYTITLTATDGAGLTATASTTAAVLLANVPPTAAATATCSYLACTFTGTGSNDPDGSITDHSWDFGDGTTGTGATADHTFDAGGTYTATLVVTDDRGGTASAQRTVTVAPNQPPTAMFTTSCTDLVCSVDAAASTDGDGTVVARSFDFGDGTGAVLGGPSTAEHTYGGGGTYTITLTATDDQGATATATTVVSVLPANVLPAAAVTATCTDLSCSADASSSADPDGSITTYAFDLGDGTTASGTDPTVAHAYAAGGTYTITVTVTDDRGGQATASQPVTVLPPNQPPTASLALSCAALTCTADSSGSADPDGTLASRLIDFGDGTTASTGTASHTFAAAGTYEISVTVTDDRGGSATTSQSVAVTPPPNDPVRASDGFSRSGTGGWGTADVGGPWTVSSLASSFATTGSAGTVSLAVGAGRSAWLLNTSATDTDLTARVATSAAATGTFGETAALVGRRVDPTHEYRARLRFAPNGSVSLVPTMLNGSTSEVALGPEVQVPGLTHAAGRSFRVRALVTGTDPTRIRLRAWLDGEVEPSTWTVDRTDATPALQAPGPVGVQSYVSGSSTAGATFTWDDVVALSTNTPPVAAFSSSCTDLQCSFDGTGSSDSEGPVAGWAWSFGDGTTTTGATSAHAFSEAGTYRVTLTTTDGGGYTTVTTRDVTVSTSAGDIAS